MAPHRTLLDPSLRSAWWRFERLWRPMALWTFLVWVLIGLVLVPLSIGFSNWIAFRGDRPILGNEELLAWLLEPAGLAYLVSIGALSIVDVVARFAGIFRLIVDDMTDRPVNVARTLLALFSDFPAVLRLCFASVGAGLILLIPLVIGPAVVYGLWLSEHDINYYLIVQPPEWTRAFVFAVIWAAAWAVGAIYVVLRGILAGPAFLDGYRPLSGAVRQSVRATRGDSLRVLRIFVLCSIAWFLIRALAHGTFFALAAIAADQTAAAFSSLRPILVVTGLFAGGTVLLDAVLSFVGFSFISTVLVKIYFEDTHLHEAIVTEPEDRRPISREVAATVAWVLRRRVILPVLLIGGAMMIVLADRLTGAPASDPRMVVVAHRAGMHLEVENTLAALERSIEAGADFAEIDVQLTRDSVIVVIHDADLMRLAGDRRRVARSDYADFASLDFGCATPEPRDCRLATLEEFIDRARGRIGLAIELKYYGPDPFLAEAVIEMLRELKFTAPDEVVIMSLSLQAVRQVRRLAPELRTGFISTVAMGNLTRVPADILAVTRRTATEQFLRAARRSGVDVYVWTINDAAAMLDVIEREVDGVITDNPVRIAATLDAISDLSPIERLLLSFNPLPIEDDRYTSDEPEVDPD